MTLKDLNPILPDMGDTEAAQYRYLYRHWDELSELTQSPEVQYQIGLYWMKAEEFPRAEQWLRYAVQQGHDEAIRLLRLGQKQGLFREDEHHFISLAIDLLETLAAPAPSETDIEALSKMLQHYFYQRFQFPPMAA